MQKEYALGNIVRVYIARILSCSFFDLLQNDLFKLLLHFLTPFL